MESRSQELQGSGVAEVDPALLVCEGSPSTQNESTAPEVEQQKSNKKHRNS